MRLTPDYLHNAAQSLGLPLPLYLRFLSEFPADDTMQRFSAAIRLRDALSAYRAAHTLKGTCAQLGLGELSDAAASLCFQLTATNTPDWNDLDRQTDALLLLHADFVREIQQFSPGAC